MTILEARIGIVEGGTMAGIWDIGAGALALPYSAKTPKIA